MKIKRTVADDFFSKCVRAAYDYTCVKCGKKYTEISRGLHCSHIYSRSHHNIRYDKLNALPMCMACHKWYGSDPIDSAHWVESFLGWGLVDILKEKKQVKCKIGKDEQKIIAKHYKTQLKLIKERRKNTTGFIDFESYQ